MINENALLHDFKILEDVYGDSEVLQKCKELVDRQDITFNIKVTMDKRWVDDFCSFLRTVEEYGFIGHSGLVGFYADGDGDFRPRFEIDRQFKKKPGIPGNDIFKKPEIMFDAG